MAGALILGAFAPSFKTDAQCDERKLRKSILAQLESYSYETSNYRALSAFGGRKQVETTFIAFKNEKYRVVNLASLQDGGFKFSIISPSGKELYSSAEAKGGEKFDFEAPESGDYQLRFIFPENAPSQTCIAYAIGYK